MSVKPNPPGEAESTICEIWTGQKRATTAPAPAARSWNTSVDGGAGPTAGPGDNSRCGPTAASTPTLSLPPAGKWTSVVSITSELNRMDGAADVADTGAAQWPMPGSQLALFARYWGDAGTGVPPRSRTPSTQVRRRAEPPSGRFAANGAWLPHHYLGQQIVTTKSGGGSSLWWDGSPLGAPPHPPAGNPVHPARPSSIRATPVRPCCVSPFGRIIYPKTGHVAPSFGS